MKNRFFLFIVFCGLLGWNPPLFADSLIVIVKSADLPIYSTTIQSFKKNISLKTQEYDIQGTREVGKKIFKEIRAKKPSLLFTLGAKASYLAKEANLSIPVIFADVINWEKYNLKAPGMTGISLEIPLETLFFHLLLMDPVIKSVGILFDPRFHGTQITKAKEIANSFNIQVVPIPAVTEKEVLLKVSSVITSIQALWMVPNQFFYTKENFIQISKLCIKKKVRFLAFSEEFVRAGALFSISPDFGVIGNQAGIMAEEILSQKDSVPQFPVQAPMGTHIILNTLTADKIGLNVSADFLSNTDVIIDER